MSESLGNDPRVELRSFLILSIFPRKNLWPCYWTVHVYVVIRVSDSMRASWVEADMFFHCLFICKAERKMRKSKLTVSKHGLSTCVGMGSSSHDFTGAFVKIFLISSVVIGENVASHETTL
jgi:hypothetical protein